MGFFPEIGILGGGSGHCRVQIPRGFPLKLGYQIAGPGNFWDLWDGLELDVGTAMGMTHPGSRGAHSPLQGALVS